ncbi:methylenetetrahydrofolate reductase [NAD(P)H] [Taibaiella chishuiensis]|uniref:Methylenetetrahydrofolate reductase n=1 Tax=Taibaiella chishuiensis TaxID=1434707 RepID=A0A2P8DBK8_9BACT|nr:methylenetetrahydrofolate reductase [NAD(P)H] [Taibaiella chishuiensis]PSK94618.1 5,10-methylenetetrahydrofolate reductase (NAD(P)) [Taibaiella chishuiensis]
MKVTDHISQADKPLISFEILPPMKGKGIDSIFKILDPLMEFKPAFVNVTYHRAEQIFKKRTDGSFDRVEIRKRPGTVGICAALMNRYRVDAVPHLICGGFAKEETENALIDLRYLGVDNVLALRGDSPANEKFFTPHPQGHRYAVDLVDQITNMNNGRYLEDDIVDAGKTDFCIGVAGYPEKHFEAANMNLDLHYLQQKIAAGAGYITTQMFFDNAKYFAYVDNCKSANIHVPIIPGLKPITNKRQLSILPSIFHVDIPNEFASEMLQCKTDAACEQLGTEWLIAQCRELLARKVPVLHFYTLGKPQVVYNVVKAIL